MQPNPSAILDFWFGPATDPAHTHSRPEWFRKDSQHDAEIARRFGPLIDEAIAILARHPLIGRPVGDFLRELVISRGESGYVALYSVEMQEDAILILSIRHQREAGYWHASER